MKHLNKEKENMQLNNKAHASQSYTLPSRSKKPTHKPKLVKEYACPNALTDRLEEGSTGYNNVYKSLGDKWLN